MKPYSRLRAKYKMVSNGGNNSKKNQARAYNMALKKTARQRFKKGF